MPKRITKGNLWGLIQSRPYTSVGDIRRTFALAAEEAAAIATPEGRAYVGLPVDAAEFLRQLYLEGRVLFDWNPDVRARVVQGVFPARMPAAREAAAAVAPASAAKLPQPGESPSGTGMPASGAIRKRRRRRRHAAADGEQAAATAVPAQ